MENEYREIPDAPEYPTSEAVREASWDTGGSVVSFWRVGTSWQIVTYLADGRETFIASYPIEQHARGCMQWELDNFDYELIDGEWHPELVSKD